MSVSETHSHPIVDCQVCGSKNLRSLLFLGYVPPVNTMPPVGERAVEQPAFPLELLRCDDCGLVQIGLEVAPEVLFPYSYPYLSGTTRILRDNFADLCEGLVDRPGAQHLRRDERDGHLEVVATVLGLQLLDEEGLVHPSVARRAGRRPRGSRRWRWSVRWRGRAAS